MSTELVRLPESAGNGGAVHPGLMMAEDRKGLKGRKALGERLSVVHHRDPGHGNLYAIPRPVSTLSHPTAVASGNRGPVSVSCVRKLV